VKTPTSLLNIVSIFEFTMVTNTMYIE